MGRARCHNSVFSLKAKALHSSFATRPAAPPSCARQYGMLLVYDGSPAMPLCLHILPDAATPERIDGFPWLDALPRHAAHSL